MSGAWTTLLAAHDAVRDPTRSLVPDHAPMAAVLTCSDARVAPSVIFDQPAGSLFVVRVAGNIPTPAVVASLDYAVAELGIELLVVLGHTNCGAVAAACAGNGASFLETLTSTISALIEGDGCHDPDHLAERNVEAAVAALTRSSTPTGRAIRSGSLIVQGAIYDLAIDDVRPLPIPAQPLPNDHAEELATT